MGRRSPIRGRCRRTRGRSVIVIALPLSDHKYCNDDEDNEHHGRYYYEIKPEVALSFPGEQIRPVLSPTTASSVSPGFVLNVYLHFFTDVETVAIRYEHRYGVITGDQLCPERGTAAQRAVLRNVRGPEEGEVVPIRIGRFGAVEEYLLAVFISFIRSGRRYHRLRFRIGPDAVGPGHVDAGSQLIVRSPPYEIVHTPIEFHLYDHLCRVSHHHVEGLLPRSEFLFVISPRGDGIFDAISVNTCSVVHYGDEAFHLHFIRGRVLFGGEIGEIHLRGVHLEIYLVRDRKGVAHQVGSPEHYIVRLSFRVCEGGGDLEFTRSSWGYIFLFYGRPIAEVPRTLGGCSNL